MNVVITGASRGIGRAIAEAFAAEGANLFLCSRNIREDEGWQNSLKTKYGVEIFGHDVDLSIESEVSGMGEIISNVFPEVDVLVNNAGIFIPGSIYNEPHGALDISLRTNLISAYLLTRQMLPAMMKRGQGHIFNICSTASLKAYPNGGAYSISKWALLGFSRNLREEMKPFGIKVTSVFPGPTLTSSWEGTNLPENRFMESADVAKMVIASSGLSYQACVEDILLRPLAGDISQVD